MKRILVAAEGAVGPQLAAAAGELAASLEAEVTVVAVDDVESRRLDPRPRGELVEQAERRAALVADLLAEAGVDATIELRQGNAADAILDLADQLDADVIVIGPSGRRQLTERLLGSLPLELIRRSSRQVLVVAGTD